MCPLRIVRRHRGTISDGSGCLPPSSPEGTRRFGFDSNAKVQIQMILIVRWSAALAVVCALTLGTPALADAPKRQLPDYSGHGPAPTTAGDVVIWLPRVVLSPLYLTSEYVIRKPLGAAIAGAERARLPSILYNFFTFGPEHKIGFAPIAFVDLGFNPDFGLYLFWDDAIFTGNDLRLHGAAWNRDWLAGSLTERIRFRHGERLTFKFSAVRRPDHVFYGIGPSTLESNRSRYGEDLLEAASLVELPSWRANRLEAGVGFRSVSLYHGHYGDDPSVEQSAAAQVFPLPFGFGRGYTMEYNLVRLILDTRRRSATPGTGLRLELAAEQGADVRRSPGSSWIRYSGTAGAFVDLNEHGRVASVAITALFADPLGTEPIPFTELVSLGGEGPMRGFYPGRLVDRSALVATAGYRWPIAPWLDGSIRAAVGDVFGVHLDEFRSGLLRLSGALGIETVGSTDGSFEALVGFGTETFEHGAQVDTVRLVLGTNRGF
jgi:hypothetical protein